MSGLKVGVSVARLLSQNLLKFQKIDKNLMRIFLNSIQYFPLQKTMEDSKPLSFQGFSDGDINNFPLERPKFFWRFLKGSPSLTPWNARGLESSIVFL